MVFDCQRELAVEVGDRIGVYTVVLVHLMEHCADNWLAGLVDTVPLTIDDAWP